MYKLFLVIAIVLSLLFFYSGFRFGFGSLAAKYYAAFAVSSYFITLIMFWARGYEGTV